MTKRSANIEVHGKKGKRGYVRVFGELAGGKEVVRVKWIDPATKTPRVESFHDTAKGLKEAKAFAYGKHEALLAQPTTAAAPATQIEPLTLRELRERYFTAHANEWETTTLRNKTDRWRAVELVLGADTLAASVTCERLDEVVTALLTTPVKRKHKKRSANQVRMALATVTAAYRWAVDERGILAPTRVVTFAPKLKQAMKKQIIATAEYSADERARLIDALDPRKPAEWRAWVLQTLFALCGPRQTAARSLEVRDLELDPVTWHGGAPVFGGRITWRAETDKMDNARVQPMPGPVAEAFWVALAWRAFDQYTGRFVFYGAQRRTRGQALRRDTHRAKAKESLEGVDVREKPYTYAALNAALNKAEGRAGITHTLYRSTHGNRRGVSGDIHSQTGSSKKAADWIGDKSTKVVEKHYLLTRTENLEEAAGLVTTTMRRATTQRETDRNKSQRPRSESEAEGVNTVNRGLSTEPQVGIEPTTAHFRNDSKRPSPSNSSDGAEVATPGGRNDPEMAIRIATDRNGGHDAGDAS